MVLEDFEEVGFYITKKVVLIRIYQRSTAQHNVCVFFVYM